MRAMLLATRRRSIVLSTVLLGGLFTDAASLAAQPCDSHCLNGFVDQYVGALTAHQPAKLPGADRSKYTENGTRTAIAAGLWQSATAVGDYKMTYVDPVTGNALFVGVIKEKDQEAIVATRLRVMDRKVTEIETIAARKGSHPLFSPELLHADPLFTTPVSEDTRVPRARMIEIANSYFDGIERNSSEGIPATPDCNRFENGVKTTFRTPTSGNCAKSADNLNYIKAVRNRRFFIVDEVNGVVACNILFDVPGGDPITTSGATATGGSEAQLQTTLRQPRMLLLTELFKIDGGNIARIQAIMHNLPHGATSGWE